MTTRLASHTFQMMEVSGTEPTSTKKLEKVAVWLPTMLITTSCVLLLNPTRRMPVERARSLACTLND
jgi:hypothetical protein